MAGSGTTSVSPPLAKQRREIEGGGGDGSVVSGMGISAGRR